MISENHTKAFCKDDISLIENYDKAIADKTQVWHCHHRRETIFSKSDLMKMGVPILGTKAEDVDAAEDRELFDQILQQTDIPITAGETAAITLPMIAASNRVIPSSAGARRTVPAISTQAGTKHMRTAGRP